LNNAGDEIALLNNAAAARDRFEYEFQQRGPESVRDIDRFPESLHARTRNTRTCLIDHDQLDGIGWRTRSHHSCAEGIESIEGLEHC
jgi:hypothetical protein